MIELAIFIRLVRFLRLATLATRAVRALPGTVTAYVALLTAQVNRRHLAGRS